MFVRISIFIAALAAVLALYVWPLSKPQNTIPPLVKGSNNNTVLFIGSEHHGLTNIHIATVQGLLERHPDIEVHFISYPSVESKLSRVSALSKARQPLARDVIFHALDGQSLTAALRERLEKVSLRDGSEGLERLISPPGVAGLDHLSQLIEYVMSPWDAEDHLAIYHQIGGIIEKVDPATIVLDMVFHPAMEAVRSRHWSHIIISPNTVVDTFMAQQPHGKMLWKYPALGSGFAFPVPWRQIPENVYLMLRLVYGMVRQPGIREKKAWLEANGVPNALDMAGTYRDDVPWITQTTPNASTPIDFIPANVTCTGPISISAAKAVDIDPELVQWISQKPTVLINLGSVYPYTVNMTNEFIKGIDRVIKETDVQVLWKYRIEPKTATAANFDWEAAVQPLLDTGRVRVSTWLKVDPQALLETGHISLFVSHGGAGGYHEGIESGVPLIILPSWVDLYNFAQLTEQTGLGIWGCREQSPNFNAECLSDAILKLSDNSPETLAIRAKSREIRDQIRAKPGRDVAADMVANMARLQ